MSIFKSKYTKWVPFGTYTVVNHLNNDTKDYIVFARKDIKSGMILFTTKRVQRFLSRKLSIIPSNLIDVKQAWEEIKSL